MAGVGLPKTKSWVSDDGGGNEEEEEGMGGGLVIGGGVKVAMGVMVGGGGDILLAVSLFATGSFVDVPSPPPLRDIPPNFRPRPSRNRTVADLK